MDWRCVLTKEVSESGRWEKGVCYIPGSGECEGHIVEVVNPEVELIYRGTTMREIRPGVSKRVAVEGPVLSVLVRCTDCFRSWSFFETEELPAEQRFTEGTANG